MQSEFSRIFTAAWWNLDCLNTWGSLHNPNLWFFLSSLHREVQLAISILFTPEEDLVFLVLVAADFGSSL
jgi:hypothetical protein